MPCYSYDSEKAKRELEEEERQQLIATREEALQKIELALATGAACVVKQPDGSFVIVGAALPQDMYDACVLSELQTRNSLGWQQASMMAGVQGQDFVSAHNSSHR